MPMGYSSNNRIVYNSMTTYITCCMVMGSCHNNTISYNRMKTLSVMPMVTSNLIYFNPWGHADYQGPGDCVGNLISYNYLEEFSNSEWQIAIKCNGESNDTRIINNTVIKIFFLQLLTA